MNKSLFKIFSVITIVALMLMALPMQNAEAASTSVFINEIHYDNTGTDTGEAIEIAGPAGTNMTGWNLILYNGANGTSYDTKTLTGTIPDLGGGFGVVVTTYPSNGIQNGAPDGMALVNASSTVVQFLSYEGTFTATNGPANGMTSTDIGVSESGTGAVGNSLQLKGTGTIYEDFTWATEAPNTFSAFNTGQTFGSVPVPTNPTGTGAAVPSTVFSGDSTLLTVAVTPGTNPPSSGLAVSCDLSSIGGLADQPFYDDGTNGDAAAGDNTFSFSTTVTAGTTGGSKSLPCIITDAQSRTGSTTISLTVTAIIPIGMVNGAVQDNENATAHRSPYAPPSGNGAGSTIVTVQGVIYEKTLQATSTGGANNGFFLQNTAATADNDPKTSDGIFVFMGSFTSLIGGYVPQVGDEVVVSAKVTEFFNMTELTSATLAKPVLHTGVDSEIAAIDANPPANLADANRYWERMQGMRMRAPAGSIVLGGRNVFNPADGEIWLARSDSTIAGRSDPYERRAFRDAHPLDDNYDPNNWDGNGYRMLIGSLGIKYAESNKDALINPARTFSTLTNAPSGGLNYTFNKYRIEVSEQPTFSEGVDPSQNNPPAVIDRSEGYSIVDYNLENLYDYRDNPFSGCDFTNVPNNSTGSNPKCNNSGTPFIDSVTPASDGTYNYVPASDAAYQARLTDIANQIINDLHSPDILMVQEVENQDICTVSGNALACGTTDNADGRPDDLQELALKIASLGGPTYDSAFDRNSSDLRGIVPSFMYRTDRVQLVSPTGDPVLGATPAFGGYTMVPYDGDISNPKTLNAVYNGTGACETNWVFPRAPDIGLFRIYNISVDPSAGPDSYRDVYVINNHFKSGPDTCVAHRTEQAKFNAALISYIQAHNPDARIVVGGDLNVYPRPDDPFAPIGQPGSSDQLGSLYDQSLGLKNLWEVELAEAPETAYSYVFVGMAQTLDQMFVNQAMLAGLTQYRTAHINSDFPADYPGDVARGTSDHDPGVANFVIFHWNGFFQPVDNLPELNIAKAGSGIPVKFSLDGDKGLNILAAGYPRSATIACDATEPTDAIEETVTAGSSGLTYDPTTDTYTYVWKTDKSWANSCRQLVVVLVDGTTHVANFKFTK